MCLKTPITNNFSVSETIAEKWILKHGEKIIMEFSSNSGNKNRIKMICDYLNLKTESREETTINEDGTISENTIINTIRSI